MRTLTLKRLASGAAALAIIAYGCDSVVDQPADGPSAPSGGGVARVESEFSDAPVSPGGTGGTADQVVEGADDVELPGEETRSFFTAFQIDPVPEDSAGPKFVVSADIDKDGLPDLVSAWNQSQPVQLHLQRRDPVGNISFRTITLAGTTPVAVVAGLQVGQINDDDGDGNINDDDWLDIVILSKATGFVALCPGTPPKEISGLDGQIIVLFNPGAANLIPDGDRWIEMILVNPFVGDRWVHNQFPGIEFKGLEESKTKPEWSGFTDLVVANIDGQPGDDIVVALNPAECEELGQKPPTNTVDLWVNPGPGLAETSEAWGAPAPTGMSRGVPVTLMTDAPQFKDLEVLDIDDDGDLDVIATVTSAISQNIRWARNPLVPHQPDGPSGLVAVVAGFKDGVDICDGGANDQGACLSDADCVGIPDGTCTAGRCLGGENDGADCQDSGGCRGIEDGVCEPGGWRFLATEWERRPIAQVDTAADVIAIGDIDNDGSEDLLVRSINGQIVQWFRQPNNLVIPPEFPPNDPVPDRFNFPWPVFTLTEFSSQEPEGIALGDVTGDGRNEVIVAVEGGVYWYDGTAGDSVYDPWVAHAIIQDGPADTTDITGVALGPATPDGGDATPGAGVGVEAVDTSTHINTLLVVDLDNDGKNDIVGTLDRRTGAGLSDDRLVWYRNTRTEVE